MSAGSSDTHCWIDVSNLGSPTNMDFIFIFLFCCLPIYWIIKIHAFSVLPFPVSPDEVSPHAQQANNHWWKETKTAVSQFCGKRRNLLRCSYASLYPSQLSQLRTHFSSSSTLSHPPVLSHKRLFTLIFQYALLQCLNQISLPIGMTIPITAAVTVESKPWPLFESVITEINISLIHRF